MLLPVKRRSLAKIENKIKVSKTSLRLLIEITIRKNIILPIVLNLPKQKNSYNFGNLHVNNWKYGG